MEQTCAEIEQSQVENLEEALVMVPREPRWILVVDQLMEAAVEMGFARERYSSAAEQTS